MTDSRHGEMRSPKKGRTSSELQTLSKTTLECELAAVNQTPSDLFASYFDPSNHINSTTESGRTVTICICGTASNREDAENFDRYVIGNTIAKIYDLVEGEPLIDKIIVDGAGSGGKTDDLWVPFQDYHVARGIALGAGIQERNQHVLAVLKNQPKRPLSELSKADQETHERLKTINQSRPITQVILDCWSRGAAVAAMELAWEMYRDKDLKHIQIVMIAHDPVTGSGQSKFEHRVIPPNVKFYHGSIAIHEASFSFHGCLPEPQDPEETVMILLEQPGGHAQGVGDENDHAGQGIPEANTRDVPVLYRFYDQLILQCHGVQLKSKEAFHIRISDTFNFYESIKKNEKAYQKIATNKSYIIPQLMGDNDRKMTDGDTYFTNQYLSDVLKRRGVEHDKKYVDSFHQLFVELAQKAVSCVDILENQLTNKLLAVEKTLYTSDTKSSIDAIKVIWQTVIDETKENELPYLYRMIGEEIMGRYEPQNFTQLGKRCYTEDALYRYIADVVSKKIGEHNKEIERQKLMAEKARREEAEKALAENLAQFHAVLRGEKSNNYSSIELKKLEDHNGTQEHIDLIEMIYSVAKERQMQLSLQGCNESLTSNTNREANVAIVNPEPDSSKARLIQSIKNQLNQYQSLLKYHKQNYPNTRVNPNENYYNKAKKTLNEVDSILHLHILNRELNKKLEKFKLYLATRHQDKGLQHKILIQKTNDINEKLLQLTGTLTSYEDITTNDLFREVCILDPHSKYQEDQKTQYESRINQCNEMILRFKKINNDANVYQISNELDRLNYQYIPQLSKELNEFNDFLKNIGETAERCILTKLKKIYDDYIQYCILPLYQIKQNYSINENQINTKYFGYLTQITDLQQDINQVIQTTDQKQKIESLNKIETQIFLIFSDLAEYRKDIFNKEMDNENEINPQASHINFLSLHDYCSLLKMKIEPEIKRIEGARRRQQATLFTQTANELPKLHNQLSSVCKLLDILNNTTEIKEFVTAFREEEEKLKSNNAGESFVDTINTLLCERKISNHNYKNRESI